MKKIKKDLGESTLEKRNTQGEILTLKTDRIERFTTQPRKHFSENYIEELAESIKTLGQKVPVTVRDLGDDRYELISGENRLRACIKHGIPKINAIVESAEMSLKEQFVTAVMANEHGRRHTHYETFLAVSRMVDEFEMTVKDLMSVYGKSDAWVYTYLSFRKLPPELQEQLYHGDRKEYLHFQVARQLVKLDTHEQMRSVYGKVKHLRPNERNYMVKKLVEKLKPTKKRERRPKDVRDHKRSLLALLDRMEAGSERFLSTKTDLQKTLATLDEIDKRVWCRQVDSCIRNLTTLKEAIEQAVSTNARPPVFQGSVGQEIRN